MQLLTAPPKDANALNAIYARTPVEGVAFSGVMHRERFGVADGFREDWSCAAITWQSGGEEVYALQDKRSPIKLLSAGALTLARGARYAYAALGETPFRSNMITFPRWITDGAAKPLLDDDTQSARRLQTRLIRPSAALQALMDEIAARTWNAAGCDHRSENDWPENHWYAEKSALVYSALLDAQDERAAAADGIHAVKASTRAELARRCERAKEIMLQRFEEPGLTLTNIAREASLSQYHLIRAFKAVTGATPMQYLSMLRMDAARRLLNDTKLTAGGIAAAVGYGDRTAFFRAFRKAYGCPPSAMGG